jgi:hypothetical protein
MLRPVINPRAVTRSWPGDTVLGRRMPVLVVACYRVGLVVELVCLAEGWSCSCVLDGATITCY